MASIQMKIQAQYLLPTYLFHCFVFSFILIICFFIAGNSKKVPESSTGKIVAIVVVTLGLPLFLIYLSVMGSGLAKGAKKVYAFICCCRRRTSSSKRTTSQGSKNNFGPTTASMPKSTTILGSNNVHIEVPPTPSSAQSAIKKTISSSSKSSASTSPVHQCRNCLRNRHAISTTTTTAGGCGGASTSTTAIEDHAAAKLMYQLQQDSTRVPVWICLLLLLSYMGAGATVFCVYNENWSFVDSFYFAFAILWTIGMYVY